MRLPIADDEICRRAAVHFDKGRQPTIKALERSIRADGFRLRTHVDVAGAIASCGYQYGVERDPKTKGFRKVGSVTKPAVKTEPPPSPPPLPPTGDAKALADLIRETFPGFEVTVMLRASS
jgi:hypothetical protein